MDHFSRSVNITDITSLTCNMDNYTDYSGYYDTNKYKDGFDFFDENGKATDKICQNYQYYSLLYKVINQETEYFPILFLTDKYHELDSIEYWIANQLFNGSTTGAWYSIAETYYNNKGIYCLNGRHVYNANGAKVERGSNIRPIITLNTDITTDGRTNDGSWKIY